MHRRRPLSTPTSNREASKRLMKAIRQSCISMRQLRSPERKEEEEEEKTLLLLLGKRGNGGELLGKVERENCWGGEVREGIIVSRWS